MARRRPLRGDVGQQIRVLQMAQAAILPFGKGQEKNGRHRPVPEIPRQIPEPRLPMAQRQDKNRPWDRLRRRIREEVLPIRRDKEPKQALPLQSAGRAAENLPQSGARLPEADRANAMRRQRHDRVLGGGQILGADPLHGPLEQRDRRLWPFGQERRPVNVFRGLGHVRRIEEKVPRTENHFPLGSRLGVLLEGVQRSASFV